MSESQRENNDIERECVWIGRAFEVCRHDWRFLADFVVTVLGTGSVTCWSQADWTFSVTRLTFLQAVRSGTIRPLPTPSSPNA